MASVFLLSPVNTQMLIFILSLSTSPLFPPSPLFSPLFSLLFALDLETLLPLLLLIQRVLKCAHFCDPEPLEYFQGHY